MLRRSSIAVAIATLVALPATMLAQSDSLPSRTHLGLAAVSAVSVNAGFASIQRGYHGLSIGGTVDFGHLATPRLPDGLE